MPAGAPRSAPLTASLPLPAQQVVEDILNHAEEIAVAEDGRSGEVTLLRLLKVRARLPRRANDNLRADTPRDFTPSTPDRSPNSSHHPLTVPLDPPPPFLPRIPQAYEAVLQEHGLVPEEGHRYYRFLLKLSLDPDPDWWVKYERERARLARRVAPRCPVDPHSAAPRRPART